MRLALFLSFLFMTAPLFAIEWTLNGGTGSKLDGSVLEVVGNGSGSNAWVSSPVEFTTGRLYRLKLEGSSPTGGRSPGCWSGKNALHTEPQSFLGTVIMQFV